MLRWSLGKTRLDKIRNEEVRESLGVRCIQDKVRGQRLRWYGHIERRDETYCGKVARKIELQGKWKKGRPFKRWEDNLKEDFKRLGAKPEQAQDRDLWRTMTCMADPK